MGLHNSNSVSGYQQQVLNAINTVSKYDKIMLKFGQVDTDFVYYIKLTNNNDHHIQNAKGIEEVKIVVAQFIQTNV
jgi:hypothetical protein